jgi:hypothetical protein
MKTKTHWLLKIWKEGKEEYWFDTKKRLLRFIRKYNWNGISCTPLIKNWKHCVKKGDIFYKEYRIVDFKNPKLQQYLRGMY